MLKKALLITALSLAMSSTCYAMTCHDLAMSYILADQDKPTKPGDKFYTNENEPNPILMETTGYCSGTHGSHGDRMQRGYCAAAPEMYGDLVMVYEAIPQDDGTYRMGDYLDTFEIRDTGYGYSSGQGKSTVRPDKKYQGTIEKGIHLDVYGTLQDCREWMKKTNGKVFAVIISGEG